MVRVGQHFCFISNAHHTHNISSQMPTDECKRCFIYWQTHQITTQNTQSAIEKRKKYTKRKKKISKHTQTQQNNADNNNKKEFIYNDGRKQREDENVTCVLKMSSFSITDLLDLFYLNLSPNKTPQQTEQIQRSAMISCKKRRIAWIAKASIWNIRSESPDKRKKKKKREKKNCKPEQKSFIFGFPLAVLLLNG